MFLEGTVWALVNQSNWRYHYFSATPDDEWKIPYCLRLEMTLVILRVQRDQDFAVVVAGESEFLAGAVVFAIAIAGAVIDPSSVAQSKGDAAHADADWYHLMMLHLMLEVEAEANLMLGAEK